MPLFGGFLPFIILTPKRTVLGLNHVIRATKIRAIKWNTGCAVRAGRWIEKKGQYRTGKKSQKRSPTEAICIKNCVVGDVLDVITCAKFQNQIFRGYDLHGVEFCIFPWIFVWALQQCSATALPMIR